MNPHIKQLYTALYSTKATKHNFEYRANKTELYYLYEHNAMVMYIFMTDMLEVSVSYNVYPHEYE